MGLFDNYNASNYGGTGGAMNTGGWSPGGGGGGVQAGIGQQSPGTGIWRGLLNAGLGVATGGLGGIVGSLGLGLGRQLFGDMFDTTAKSQEQTLSGLQQGAQQAIQMAPGMTKASMYSAAGTAGPDVAQQYRDRSMSLGQSAGAMKAMADLDASKKSMLGQAGQQGRLAQMLAERQGGQLRRDAIGSMRAMGGSPAAMSGIVGQITQGQQGGLLQNLANAGQQQMGATQAAAGMTGQQQGIAQQDIMNRYQRLVRPWEAQLNAGIPALAGTMGGSMAGAVNQDKAAPNIFGGFAEALGQTGGGIIGGQFPNLMGLGKG